MGTTVLHPQDYLAVQQSDQHCRFSYVSECPSSAVRPRPNFAIHEGCGRDVAIGNTVPNQGLKNASAGLLPLPKHVSPTAHSSLRRLAPTTCGSGEIPFFYVSKHSDSRMYAHISRCSSVPMLEHAACMRRLSAGCFPLHAAQPHENRPSQRSSNLHYPTGSLSNATGATLPCEKLKCSPSSHFYDVFSPESRKWLNCTEVNRKRMQPEVFQAENLLGRPYPKPPLKVLPDGQGKSICTSTSVSGKKYGVNKQLKRSASEKMLESPEAPILRRPRSNKVTITHTSSLFEEVLGLNASRVDLKPTSSASAVLSLQEGKIVKALHRQACLDAESQGRNCVCKSSKANSLQRTFPPQIGGTEINVGASLHEWQCHGSMNAIMEHIEVKEGDEVAGTAACEKAACVSHAWNDHKGDEVLESMMDDEKWAGPSFFNSPSPSSVPLPSFILRISRTASTMVSIPTKTGDHGHHTSSNVSLLEANRSWDVAFATKDLRRMLNLDHAPCVS